MTQRYRQQGPCQDCGHDRQTTWITFWATGFRYRVCALCSRAYQGRYLKKGIVPNGAKAPVTPRKVIETL